MNNNNNADEDDDDDKNCEDYKQTNQQKKAHENMTHIHPRMDNKIFLFAPDIFK